MKYILMIKEKDKKYDGYERFSYMLFDNYYELQKHLIRFRYIGKNNYVVFKETNIKKKWYCV